MTREDEALKLRKLLEKLVRRQTDLESYVNNVLKPREGASGKDGLFAYGEIYVHDSLAGGTVIPTGVVYTKYTDWQVNGLSKNCTNDQANDKITITEAGIYRVDVATSFFISRNGVNVMGAAFLNGVEQDQLHYRRNIGTANDEGAAGATGFIDVKAVPWDLDWRFRHDNGANVTVTITYGNMNLIYIGKT